jgi:glycosyltransferase involved in cell wall biosynthesis
MSSDVSEKWLISIIVPAYNVDKYIENCILSIVSQTYTNFELIVVDDGSTDRTKEIIDTYAEKDERIFVLHKKNEGVSSARNDGLDISRGDYVVFIDGDDYISKDFLSYLLNIAMQTGADFCLSKNCYIKTRDKQVRVDNISILNPEEGTALLLSPLVTVGCWNKIFRRNFLIDKNIRFSPALFYGEGLYFITTAAQVANYVAVGNRRVYYYRRSNEESATTKFNIEKLLNGEKALCQIKKDRIIKSHRIDNMFLLHMCTYCLGAIVRIKKNHLENVYRNDYKRWKVFLRHNLTLILFIHEVSLYRKFMLLGGVISPWIIAKLDIIRSKRNKIYSV